MADWNYLSSNLITNPNDLITILLNNRQVSNQDLFLNPTLPRFWPQDESTVPLEQVNKFKNLLSKHKNILVYGDYDADGVISSTIMTNALEYLGHQVQAYIPDRKQDGYGMSVESLQKILSSYPNIDLVITVDQGISAHAAIEFLKSKNITVIVTDHHLYSSPLPNADLIVHNPSLCGSAVVYFLTRHLLNKELNHLHLQLSAIATVTDVMPLIGINRNLVYHGLQALKKTQNPALLALIEASGIVSSDLETYHLGYYLGPRLNASGRISNSILSYQLLKSKLLDQARSLAKDINETNVIRQQLTESMYAIALKNLDLNQNILVSASQDFDEGIIGLIAGKLTQQYHKTSLVISLNTPLAKGSARSPSGVNIVEILNQASSYLSAYGGHAQAGGFSFPAERYDSFKSSIYKIGQTINSDSLKKRINIDAVVPFDILNQNLINEINRLSPFGHANPNPIFCTPNVQVIKTYPIGKQSNHLKIFLKDQNSNVIECLAWGQGHLSQKLVPEQIIDVAYTPKKSFYQNQVQINVELTDYHDSSK